MNLESKNKIFNPRLHQEDLLTAFNKFVRKFEYIYAGENRTVPLSLEKPEEKLQWQEEDKTKLFLARAVSDEFLDDYESIFPNAANNKLHLCT